MAHPTTADERIRAARPGDVAAIAEVHVRSWQVAYDGQLPADLLANLDPEPRARAWARAIDDEDPAVIVAVDDRDVPIGFVAVGASRDGDAEPHVGEVVALYLDPDRWDRGEGRALLASGVARLREAGFTTASLWVLTSNERTIRFYERAGWRANGDERVEDLAGTTVRELRYRRAL